MGRRQLQLMKLDGVLVNTARVAVLTEAALVEHLQTHPDSGQVHNPEGQHRVVVTKVLPGERWTKLLVSANCRVEVCTAAEPILGTDHIAALIGSKCDAVIGQLTETAYSNYAVGFNNVAVAEATARGIPVGNTPGVLTETSAELAAALTLAAARRVAEGDAFMRAGHFQGWLPTLFVGKLLQGKKLGVVGAGRIGAAYARMMVEGHKMDLLYFSRSTNTSLEDYVRDYGSFLESHGERAVTAKRCETLEQLLQEADVVSLHCSLTDSTRHLIGRRQLQLMKPDAVLVNTARGPVVDEAALVEHLQARPDFRAGLDVFEDEPRVQQGLAGCQNAVLLPHIASATEWTRSGMATLAAANVAAILQGYPVWGRSDALPFVDGPFEQIPKAAPSIVNATELGLAVM
ncbi:hypothetical protein N2152v2_002894 [Parachlorella kessleri]